MACAATAHVFLIRIRHFPVSFGSPDDSSAGGCCSADGSWVSLFAGVSVRSVLCVICGVGADCVGSDCGRGGSVCGDDGSR